MPQTKVVNSPTALKALLSASPSRISVIDFHASWCGPCHMIAPRFEQMSDQYRQVQFLKVDVDAQQAIAKQYKVTAMPTFIILKGSNQVAEMKGANPTGLEDLIKKHAGPPQSSYNEGGSSNAASGSGSSGLDNFVSLDGSLDLQQVSCLNEHSSHTLRDLLRKNGNGGGYVMSDADEQLLMHIPCQNALRIKALRFKSNSEQTEKAPKTVKLFINNPTLGFDDAESLEPAQTLDLTPDQATGKETVELRFVRFQKVNSLQIFVVDNQGGGDETRCYGVEVVGVAGEGTDMKALKKLEDE